MAARRPDSRPRARASMGRNNRRNYYRLLHVQSDAPLEVIKASYRTLMRSLKKHPDLGGDQWDAALINEAYAVLSTPERRETYDRDHTILKESVGRTLCVPSKPVEEPAKLGSTLLTQQVTLEPVRPRICAFCKTENSRNHQRADEVCRGCGGPLTRLIDVAAGHSNRRTARRIEHETDIHYRADSSRPRTTSGQMVDLSPTGLRFLSRRRLTPGHVIKIDSATLSAVARVTRSSAADATGLFTTGVRFLTLALGCPRGTFVSEHA